MTTWYKEPWPWILMSGPAIVIVAGAATAWIAFASADGLVAEDYYKRGLAVNAVLAREQAAARLGVSAHIWRGSGRVRIRLSGAAPEFLFVTFVHPTRAGFDQRLRLAPVAPGVYEAKLAPLAPGRWSAVLEDPRGEWRMVKEGA